MSKIILDLNVITNDYKHNDEWFFIKNAIKSAIVDAKIARGRNVVIEFSPRTLGGEDRIGRAFDLAVNGAANNILKEFNCNEY